MPKQTQTVHRTSDWCHTQAPKEITKILLRCGYESGYYSQIFDDFLDACEIWLDRLPTAFRSTKPIPRPSPKGTFLFGRTG